MGTFSNLAFGVAAAIAAGRPPRDRAHDESRQPLTPSTRLHEQMALNAPPPPAPAPVPVQAPAAAGKSPSTRARRSGGPVPPLPAKPRPEPFVPQRPTPGRARRTVPFVPADPPQVPGPPSTADHYFPPYLAARTPDRKPPRNARKPLPGQEPLF